eukprot:TRINITY_DN23381_c0_g1_i1.p1 TRINITY_DN23381_c0_g1~~TRINITY_DN23381_c0_g1_i1.p1  ORF type:complete len:191 (-),score=40.76 TRINITY_DN23381_c0_g1_i1:60-632(-)
MFYFVVPSTFAAGKEGGFYFSMVASEQVTILESQNAQEATSALNLQQLTDDTAVEELPDWEGESKGKRTTDSDDFTMKTKAATVLKASAAWTGGIQWGEKSHDKQYEERRMVEEVEKRQLTDPNARFEDAEFPAEARSLYHACQPYPGAPDVSDVVWLRPHEFCDKPTLFADGIEPVSYTHLTLPTKRIV